MSEVNGAEFRGGRALDIYAAKPLVAGGGKAVNPGDVVARVEITGSLTLHQVANGICIGSCTATKPELPQKGLKGT